MQTYYPKLLACLVFTMIMFLIETREANGLGEQQKITPQAQAPDKSLTP
jgi:hypothetical protein